MTSVSANLSALVDLSMQHLRQPASAFDDPVNGPTLIFDPPLSTSEAATYANLQQAVSYGLGRANPAMVARIWPQIQACAALMNDPTPTNAEAIAALKALILIVRDMFVAGTQA